MVRNRGFTLIEVCVALGIGAVLIAGAVSAFTGALDEQAHSKREWQAFTIAQQNMELLASVGRDHPLLSPNVDSTVAPGSVADQNCTGIPLGTQHFRTNGLGVAQATGSFEVCFKVTDGHPAGSLKNIRVVVLYTYNETHHVMLHIIR